ncbi:MAG: mechanosensitive ion channel domain-containing protein [Pseudomonadota bacterium]
MTFDFLNSSLNGADVKELIETFKPAIHITIILSLAWLALRLSRKFGFVFNLYMSKMSPNLHNTRRVETLRGVLRYATSVVIGIVTGMLVLGEVGISVAPLLATAGVAGIAIGFGAQSLVKDFFTGLFLLLEDQVSEGDIIEAAGKTGYVEHVTLRHIRLRDYDGSVHFIPNGMITTVTNKSREFAFAVIDFNVPRQQNIDEIFKTMRRVADEMRKDPKWEPKIVDDIDIAGIEKIEDASATIRCRLKVIPLKQWSVRREFLKRMAGALDQGEAVKAA